MKISLNWLKDYVAVGIPSDKLAHKLTMAGHEVEKIWESGGDTIIEMEITPNRPDCLNMVGMAREVAAILGKPRKFPKTKKRVWPKKKCAIEVLDKEACPRYIGTLIEGVSIKKAQERIITRLTALDMRPINNVVDVTNFCLMETGQPMHAFDYDKLIGGKIIVRRARKGEKIVTLDDVERELDPTILVIADEKRAVAIAGIMGGKNTEVTTGTKNILLESAYFDPVLIRRASRKLGLSSDSSYRFERGVDYDTVESGASRAIDLLLETAQGKITKRCDVAALRKKGMKGQIAISREQINSRIGASLTALQCKKILKQLEFKVVSGKKDFFKISPPSFRNDIKGPEDIVEEIARIIGYDNLPLTFPQIKTSAILSSSVRRARQQAKNLLLAQGFNEAITYTMISRKNLEMSGQEDLPAVAVFNPLTQEQEIMRPTMLPGMLSIVLTNINKGQKDLKFFETGKIYTAKGERDALSIVMTGLQMDDWRQIKKEILDYYDLKGALEQMLERMGVNKNKTLFQSVEKKFFEEGQSSEILIDGKSTGVAGKIDEAILEKWGIKQKNVLFAEINMEGVYRLERAPKKYVPVQEFPSISRDISMAVSVNVVARDIEQVIYKTVGTQKQIVLEQIKFIEKYEGDKIPQDRRGLVFSLTYRSSLPRTLRDEEVTEVHDKVCEALVRDLSVIRR